MYDATCCVGTAGPAVSDEMSKIGFWESWEIDTKCENKWSKDADDLRD